MKLNYKYYNNNHALSKFHGFMLGQLRLLKCYQLRKVMEPRLLLLFLFTIKVISVKPNNRKSRKTFVKQIKNKRKISRFDPHTATKSELLTLKHKK